MPRLKSANFAVTELASGITNAATSFQVVDASLFPNEGPFIVLVHDSTPGFAGVREIMEVGSINKGTNTFSDVLRGREGTFPVAHSAGARAECVWTAGTHGELADKVELDNLAGIGRTTETVKGNADNLSSHMADHVRIELSEFAPSNPGTNTWWYEDLGETADLGGGDGGLLLGNASTEEGDDVWFDEV